MNDCWVIVADGARARFMALEKLPARPPRAPQRLVESARLSNPVHTVKGRRDARKIKSGRDTGRGRMEPHGFTDHREKHEVELLRRFATRIAKQAATLVAGEKVANVVLVADAHMLGLLRTEFEAVKRTGIRLRELARDYTWCSATQLYRNLEDNGLLPSAS